MEDAQGARQVYVRSQQPGKDGSDILRRDAMEVDVLLDRRLRLWQRAWGLRGHSGNTVAVQCAFSLHGDNGR
jgi:hypothetical protein